MKVGADGELLSDEVFPCKIINKRRLNYREAQEIIDGQIEAPPAVVDSLRSLNELALIIRQRRLKEGSIDFALPEVKVRFDDKGMPVSVGPYPKYGTNNLVEEFMLLANKAVAIRLKKQYNKAAMFRIHEPPDNESLKPIFQMMRDNKIAIGRAEGAGAFKAAVEAVRGTPIEKAVNTMVLRAMTKAKYSAENKGHFGLAFSSYTHFTSPIRRYPDLVVHRLLLNRMGAPKVKPKDLNDLALQLSECEERSMKAERDGVSLSACKVLHNHLGEEYNGVISGMIEAGVFVELPGLGVDGMIHVSKLGQGYFYFDPNAMVMIGRDSGQRIRIGDGVRIRVEGVSIALRRVDLIPITFL